MIADRGADTLLTDTPEAVRGVWALTSLFGVFVAIGLAVGIDSTVDGAYGVSLATLGLVALCGMMVRATLLRYRITVSDDQVRIQRLFRPLVRPKDESASRDELLGYFVMAGRGVKFVVYKKSGGHLCCLVRTFTITSPEFHQAMQRHGIPRTGPGGRPLSQSDSEATVRPGERGKVSGAS